MANQAVVFKFIGERFAGLEKLVAVVDPGWPNEATYREDDGRLPKVFRGDEVAACVPDGVNRRKNGGHRSGILEVIAIAEKMANCPI